jgi:5-methylcytosine-specific restriction endonuclease McrA
LLLHITRSSSRRCQTPTSTCCALTRMTRSLANCSTLSIKLVAPTRSCVTFRALLGEPGVGRDSSQGPCRAILVNGPDSGGTPEPSCRTRRSRAGRCHALNGGEHRRSNAEMRRLQRLGLPDDIGERLDRWRTELCELVDAGGEIPEALRNRYRSAELKAILRRETADKCSYCEAHISHVYPGDVEHIVPKAIEPRRMLDYENLTYACAECNRNKGTYYDPAHRLLHPYDDDPRQHLAAFGPMILHLPGARRGQLTEKRLGLNRQPLLERRTERLLQLVTLVDRYVLEPEGPLKGMLRAELEREAGADAEYTLVAKTFLETVGIT